MTISLRRAALLGTASATCLALGYPRPAMADQPGLYFGLKGAFLMPNGSNLFGNNDEIPIRIAPSGDGGGAQIDLGYRFNNAWDARLSLSGNWLSDSKFNYFSYSQEAPEGLQIRGSTDYYVADFDAGYTMKLGLRSHLRLSGGIEYARFDQDYDVGILAGPTEFDIASLNNRYWGIGPVIGAEGKFALGSHSPFSVVGSVTGSALFGNFKQSYSYSYSPGLSSSDSRTAYSLRADVGLAYDFGLFNNQASLVAGYQFQQWWNVNEVVDIAGEGERHGDETFNGPFVQLRVNY